MESNTIYGVLLKCAERQIASSDFLNLYKEFYNEKFSKEINSDDSQEDYNRIGEISETIAVDLIKLLNQGKHLLLADYIVQVLFVNYNSELIRVFLPKLYSVSNEFMLVHFFSKACAFLAKLTDKLITDQLTKDIPNSIIPGVLIMDVNIMTNELVVSVSKFLQLVLKFVPTPINISSQNERDNAYSLIKRLSQINKLLHKNILQIVEAKLVFKDSKLLFPNSITSPFISSPSLTSPQYIASPLAISKESTSTVDNLSNHKDMRLLRYYKNIWLNYKIYNWASTSNDFLSRYASISPSLFPNLTTSSSTTDEILTDLIETSFTCFAQFVSNSQYHQTNASFSLLEKQWCIFITKQLPLLVQENSSGNQQIVTKALERIDDKVVKAIKSYYAEKIDINSRTEDLFDDSPSSGLDIRHDFIKNLVMQGLQPPNLINEYLREDQSIDARTLITSNELFISNSQGVKEIIRDIKSFVVQSLDALELERLNDTSNIQQNGLKQVFMSFETISPTKQKEISSEIINVLRDSSSQKNFSRLSKLSAILSFNYSHILTSILATVGPVSLLEILTDFVDNSWDANIKSKGRTMNDTNDELASSYLTFSWVTLLIFTISKTYDISLVDISLKSSILKPKKNFSVCMFSKLAEISDDYSFQFKLPTDNIDIQDPTFEIKKWFEDLFVNGTLSDSLLQNVDIKQLIELVPFIFKQVILAVEAGIITDISKVTNGFEYFLQPSLIIGFINISSWLEEYFETLKANTLSDERMHNILTVLNSLLTPASLNGDCRPFHNAVLRLNAPGLLKVVRSFRVPSQSNYGIYSSEAQGHPMIESLITKLVDVLNMSPVYNIDSRIMSSESSYPKKQLRYKKFLILNELPMDKILSNQINSFWNLHSSTYYNMDYLRTLIDLLTPKRFLKDVAITLDFKLATFGIPGSRNKANGVDIEHVLDYVFYFVVLSDVNSQDEASQMISWMDNDFSKVEEIQNLISIKKEVVSKPEQNISQDDDFDMLFGENETSVQGIDEEGEPQIIDLEIGQTFNQIAMLKRNSFAYVLQGIKYENDMALRSGDITQEEYHLACKYHRRYLSMLKTCIF